ncbi:MAG TPA: hypothetical protein VGZ52_09715 [Acidimicrobiales bacterium]|jgi:hypothetical protein|nr:hypothetical protein [Acidimicrobiales bacterium]
MTASSAARALPSSALSVSRSVADHDLVARIARGQNLLRRSVHGRSDVIAFARDLAEWSGHNRDLLAKRFTDRRLADAYSSAAEPFVVPAHDISVLAQAELLQGQLRHQLAWLEQLRATIDERDEPVTGHDPRLGQHRGAVRAPVVVASSASRMAVAVVGAVARATGVLPNVIETRPDDDRSLLRATEQSLPADALAIVVVEAASPAFLLALGYIAGALGPQDVIAVCAPGVAERGDLGDFATVTMSAGDAWRFRLAELLERAGYRPAEVVVRS